MKIYVARSARCQESDMLIGCYYQSNQSSNFLQYSSLVRPFVVKLLTDIIDVILSYQQY
jgi:hypothetical protein